MTDKKKSNNKIASRKKGAKKVDEIKLTQCDLGNHKFNSEAQFPAMDIVCSECGAIKKE